MTVHDLIEERWSPRSFSDRNIAIEDLELLFEAARKAPSSWNEQPWRFVYATKNNQEAFYNILGCLSENNQKWAKTAPVLMFTIAKTNFTKNGKQNKHAFHDVGLAMGQLILQAMELNIYVHQMAGYDASRAKINLNLPEGFEPVAAVAIGYLGSPERLPEEMREKEGKRSTRKLQEEIVFQSKFREQ